MNQLVKTIAIAIIFGAIAGGVTTNILSTKEEKSTNELIKDFYAAETAVHVSPHHIRKAMMKGNTDDFILVDTRSQEEYEREHIIGAINIPAYKDPETSAYGDVERIVGDFSKLDQNKDIIVYCYSIPCMTGRKIGNLLAENGVYVQLLGVGWNEWRYYWNLWNHEHEWDSTDVTDYTFSGEEPGVFVPTGEESTACPIENDLGC